MDPEMLLGIGLPLGITLVIFVLVVIPALRQMRNATATIKGGLQARAIVQSIADTGTTISTPSIGADAPLYRFELLVTPPGGGAPYVTQAEQAVPRVFLPLMIPGVQVSVDVDPADPQRVRLDWQNLQATALPGFTTPLSMPAFAAAGATTAADGMALATATGAAALTPQSGAALVAALDSGAVPQIKGKAAELLATGIKGTARVTTAMPLGTVGHFFGDAADPAIANDPVWMFNVEVRLDDKASPGTAPFPAAFGHRVPAAKVAQVVPGSLLSVAVDPKNPTQDVAIDWDLSPLP